MPKVGYTRQKQIRNLRFATVAIAQNATTVKPNEVCFVKSKNSHYYYEPNGAHLVVNGDTVLSTGNGGSTRWFKLYPSVSRKVSVTANTPKTITHNLNTPNVHVSVVRDGDEVDVEVYGFTDDTLFIRTDVTGTYEVMVTRVERLTNYIYISIDNGIRRINPDTLQLFDTISIPGTDMSAVVWFDGFIYVGDQLGTSNFYKINPDTGLVVGTLNILGAQFGPIRNDGTFLYVVDGANSRVCKINPAGAMSLSTTMTTGGAGARTLGLDLDLNRDLGYVTNYINGTGNSVEEFRISTMALTTRSIAYTTNRLRGCVLVGTDLFVSRINYSADGIYKINTVSMTQTSFTLLGAGCGHPKLYQGNIYVNVYSSNKVSRLNPASLVVLDTPTTILGPRTLGMYAGKGYAVGYTTGILTEFDANTMALTGRTLSGNAWPLGCEVL